MAGNLRREISAIALPAIVSNITTPLLGLVDVAITGHLGSADYIGAIAVGGAMFNMLYWLFNFLRMGTSGLTAQAWGAENRRTVDTVFFRTIFVGLGIAVVMLVLQSPLSDIVLRFMDADDAVAPLAQRYFTICIWGAPAVMMTYGLTGWFLGVQNTRATMWVAIVTNLVNIALSTVLVFGLGLRIEGVALGTTLAQWVGVVLGFAIVFFKYKPRFPGPAQVFEPARLKEFFRINIDIFLRTACLVAVTVWFTRSGARQSTEILSANALLLQLFMLFSFFMDGFAYAGEALAGKYYGAGRGGMLSRLIAAVMKTGLVTAIVFAGLYALGGEALLRVLSDEPEVVKVAVDYLPWACAIPLCGFTAFAWDGILVGLTLTRIMLKSMAAAVLVFFAAYFTLRTSLANHGLWLAFDLYLIVRGLVEYLLFRRQNTEA